MGRNRPLSKTDLENLASVVSRVSNDLDGLYDALLDLDRPSDKELADIRRQLTLIVERLQIEIDLLPKGV